MDFFNYVIILFKNLLWKKNGSSLATKEQDGLVNKSGNLFVLTHSIQASWIFVQAWRKIDDFISKAANFLWSAIKRLAE